MYVKNGVQLVCVLKIRIEHEQDLNHARDE